MSGKEGNVTDHGRRDRLLEEDIHDPYQVRRKPPEPTFCPGCGAVFRKGRWQWASSHPEAAHERMCPACERTRDDMPAGILTLKGHFLDEHREEILQLIRNKIGEEKASHPLKRLIRFEDGPDGELIARFTDLHLPRDTGEAVERAYEGELDIQYTKGSNLVRVYWRRD